MKEYKYDEGDLEDYLLIRNCASPHPKQRSKKKKEVEIDEIYPDFIMLWYLFIFLVIVPLFLGFFIFSFFFFCCYALGIYFMFEKDFNRGKK